MGNGVRASKKREKWQKWMIWLMRIAAPAD